LRGVDEAAVVALIVENTLDGGAVSKEAPAGPTGKSTLEHVPHTPPRIGRSIRWSGRGIIRGQRGKIHKPCHAKSRSSGSRDKPMERTEPWTSISLNAAPGGQYRYAAQCHQGCGVPPPESAKPR
jgi:hypothetical protein